MIVSVEERVDDLLSPIVATLDVDLLDVEFAGGKDLAIVKKFYSDAFGWGFVDYGPEYASFTSAGLDGGFNAMIPPAAGSTLIILYADDLEASEKNVVAAGGVVTERHEFPGGRRFHFTDPVGNLLAVWSDH